MVASTRLAGRPRGRAAGDRDRDRLAVDVDRRAARAAPRPRPRSCAWAGRAGPDVRLASAGADCSPSRAATSLSRPDQQRPPRPGPREVSHYATPVHGDLDPRRRRADLDLSRASANLDLKRHARRPSARASAVHAGVDLPASPSASGFGRKAAWQRRRNRRDLFEGRIGREKGRALPLLQELVQIAGVESRLGKRRLLQHPAEKGDGRPDAAHLVLAQRAPHPRDRLRPVRRPTPPASR